MPSAPHKTANQADDHPSPPARTPLARLPWHARLLLAFAVIGAGPALACGSFAPRPTPTPTVPAPPTALVMAQETPAALPPTAAPVVIVEPPPAPAVVLTATVPITSPAPAPAAPAANVLAPGGKARVTAPNGLNMRSEANPGGALILQLATGQIVSVVEGPAQAEGFTWWKVDNGAGQSGWVAERDAETVWLSPQIGEPQPVNRAPLVGERVIISIGVGGQVSIRSTPGTNATLITRADPGAQFTVLAGPQAVEGYNWYQIRSDNGQIEGWAADGDGTTRWISPLE